MWKRNFVGFLTILFIVIAIMMGSGSWLFLALISGYYYIKCWKEEQGDKSLPGFSDVFQLISNELKRREVQRKKTRDIREYHRQAELGRLDARRSRGIYRYRPSTDGTIADESYKLERRLKRKRKKGRNGYWGRFRDID